MAQQNGAIQAAIDEAIQEGARAAEGGAAVGACHITVQGRTACRSGVNEADCNRAAKKAGGVARWVEGGNCT